MTHSYPLGAKVISEFVGTCLTIWMGESILANELLPSTKGHGMGLLAVSIGFGLAFGVNIAWFGFISAHLNPAMFFFLALIGKVPWEEFAACACANFAGAFLGAVLVAIFFGPHFGFSLPLPSNVSEAATFLEGNVTMDKDAGRIASAFGPASRKKRGETIGEELHRFFPRNFPNDENFRAGSSEIVCLDDPECMALLDKMEHRHQRRVEATAEAERLKLFTNSNKSLQVAALLHGRDVPLLSSSVQGDNPGELRHSVQVAGLLHTHDNSALDSRTSSSVNGKDVEVVHNSSTGQTDAAEEEAAVETNDNKQENKDVEAEDQKARAEQEASLAAYRAALQADASAKLSIFATRPAIFNRPYNFLQEMLLTAALVLGAELFNLRRETQNEVTGVPMTDGPFLQSLYVALYITMLILGLGGVTGLAANPARDLGPRLAHQLMPIPGKGSSEWNYGLIVPLFGPFTGAALGAAVFKGMEALFEMVEIEEEAGAGVEL